MQPVTVVTGGASGLGRVIADVLLERGRQVVLVDRDGAALRATSHDLAARHGRRPGHVVADLSDTSEVRSVAAEVSTSGPVAGLVNNAGGQLPGDQYPLATADVWLSALTLNLVAPMLLAQLLWPQLAAASGAVVSIGSSGGEGGAPYASPEYGAAKAGLRRWTTALGDRTDVRVTAVVPGWVGLDRAQRVWATLTPQERQDAGPLIPPELIALTVADLLDHGRPGEVVDLLDDPTA